MNIDANTSAAMSAMSAIEGKDSDKESLLEIRVRKSRAWDRVFYRTTQACAILIIVFLGVMTLTLAWGSLPAFKAFGWSFLTDSNWDPVANKFGAVTPIVGTLITSFIALALAVPISFGVAIFLTELSPRWLRTPLGVTIELLAAVPSIIYGMWGLFVLAPFLAKYVDPFLNNTLGEMQVIGRFFKGPPLGLGMLTAGIILAIMIIPFITAVMRDVFLLVPNLMKEAGFGLGANTWEVLWQVIVPYTRKGVLGGVILGLGRALGETMAVTFVIGNSHELSTSLLMPSSTISSALANEFTEAVGVLHTSSLIALGLLLFFVTFIVLSLAKLLIFRMQAKTGDM